MLFIIPLLQMGKLRLREAMPGFLEKSGFRLSLDCQSVKGNYTFCLLLTPIRAPISSHLFLNGVLLSCMPTKHPFC